LVEFQAALQAELPVPVWTSSLLKLPDLTARAWSPSTRCRWCAPRAAGADATVP
jgi:hypothetical protein